MTGASLPTESEAKEAAVAAACAKCGYDMSGSSDSTCPECGMVAGSVQAGQAAMKKHAVRGSIWTLGGYGAQQAVRVANSLILTRLLDPTPFGIMNLVNTFLQGLQMFSDIGIRPSIIQSKRGDDPVFLNTAWTMGVVRGVILWVVACLAAWPVSLFFDVPALKYLIPVAGITALLSGFNSTSLATANRKFAFGRLAVFDLGLQIVSCAAVIVCAIRWPSPWALVVGGLVNAVAGLVASHVLIPGIKHRFAWDKPSVESLMKFGRWIFLSTAITFLSIQSDRIVLGKVTVPAMLGIYGIAIMWSRLPGEVFQKLAMGVFFPIMSSSINSSTFDPQTIKRMRMSMLLPVAIGCGGVMAVARPTIELMYRPAFAGAGPLLAILVVGTWIGTVQYTYGAILLAAGKPKYISYGTAAKTLVFLAAAYPMYRQWGVEGVAAAAVLSELALLIPVEIGARAVKVASPARELVLTGVGAVYGAVMYELYVGLRAVIASPMSGKIAGVAAVGVITGVICLACLRSLFKGVKAAR